MRYKYETQNTHGRKQYTQTIQYSRRFRHHRNFESQSMPLEKITSIMPNRLTYYRKFIE